jgi:hypothetical protein
VFESLFASLLNEDNFNSKSRPYGVRMTQLVFLLTCTVA